MSRRSLLRCVISVEALLDGDLIDDIIRRDNFKHAREARALYTSHPEKNR